MSQRVPEMVSVRAIEDIIQIPKVAGKSVTFVNSDKDQERIDRVILTLNKCEDDDRCNATDNMSSIFQADADVNFKCNDRIVFTRIEGDGCEGDNSNFHGNSEVVENCKNACATISEAELKSWPSDSDITVLRMRKEYRSALISKVEWEDNRNLSDDASESLSFDWESHSLINLAEVMLKEKDQIEGLTPFTIWSKKSNLKTPLTISQKNPSISETQLTFTSGQPDGFSLGLNSFPCSEDKTNEIKKNVSEGRDELSVILKETEKEARKLGISSPLNGNKETDSRKWNQFRCFLKSLLSCGAKKKSFDDNI